MERIFAIPGYPYYAYDEDNAYQQYASQEQYRQWADYAAQQQYEDSAAQANYYNWAADNSYKQPKKDVLKVASNKNTNKVHSAGPFLFFLCVLPASAWQKLMLILFDAPWSSCTSKNKTHVDTL